MPLTKQQIIDKITKQPQIKTSIRKVKAKGTGRTFYVVETRITQFYSQDYLDKVMKGNQQSPKGIDAEDLF